MLRIALSFQVKHLSIRSQALDDHESGGFSGKDLVPVSEGEVGGHDRAKPPVMPIGDDLEKEISCLGIHRHVAEFVYDQKLRFAVFSELALQIVSCFGRGQVIHDL